MRTASKHLRITGCVQGVGFRNYLEYKAQQLGVCGWVRNRADGSVEAVAYGIPKVVDDLIACARRGPRAAQVSGVEVSEMVDDTQAIYTSFETRPTV